MNALDDLHNDRVRKECRMHTEAWLIGGLRKGQPKGLDSMIVVGYTIPGHGFRCSFRLVPTNLHINSILVGEWFDRDQVEWAAGFVAGDSIASWPLAMFAAVSTNTQVWVKNAGRAGLRRVYDGASAMIDSKGLGVRH